VIQLKAAITAKVESMVNPGFGLCIWFIVINTETGGHQIAINEQNLHAT
jgi:hypothetical protein